MRHPKAEEWELKLKKIFDKIDEELEHLYGSKYPLRSGREPHGITMNREDDGLFDIGAAFSAGYGSAHGAGYVIEIRMSTPVSVPADVRKEIELYVVKNLRKMLPDAFPGRNLKVEQDGHVFKIVGDLGLDDSK